MLNLLMYTNIKQHGITEQAYTIIIDQKLSYCRETARQLRMST